MVYEFDGYEDDKIIFGVNAMVSFDDKSKKYTVSFGSCNDDIDFMTNRIKVINKAFAFAKHLNKMK